MNQLILGLIFLVLAIFGIVLKKTYFLIPAHELKRRANRPDPLAVKLYRPVSYGNSLKILLWLFIGLTSAASFILFARVMPLWASLLIVGPLIYIVFSLIPNTKVTRFGIFLTKIATPFINKLLYYLHPVFSLGSTKIENKYIINNHTGLYEPSDFIKLLERQQNQDDNRLSSADLDRVKRSLLFADKKVLDILIPRKKVKTILASDTIGPILINDLHEAQQDYVLVKESTKGQVIGTLAFTDLNLKSHGQVKNVMNNKVDYLNENDSLISAVNAFFQTHQTMFVVLNNFEEFVGIVTIDQVIKEILGQIEKEDFEAYDNPIKVANKFIGRDQKDKKPTDDQTVNSETEVIE